MISAILIATLSCVSEPSDWNLVRSVNLPERTVSGISYDNRVIVHSQVGPEGVDTLWILRDEKFDIIREYELRMYIAGANEYGLICETYPQAVSEIGAYRPGRDLALAADGHVKVDRFSWWQRGDGSALLAAGKHDYRLIKGLIGNDPVVMIDEDRLLMLERGAMLDDSFVVRVQSLDELPPYSVFKSIGKSVPIRVSSFLKEMSARVLWYSPELLRLNKSEFLFYVLVAVDDSTSIVGRTVIGGQNHKATIKQALVCINIEERTVRTVCLVDISPLVRTVGRMPDSASILVLGDDSIGVIHGDRLHFFGR